MIYGLATSNKIGLAAMGTAFIVFSLAASFLFPRFNPDFPTKKGLRWFIPLCFVFFFAMMGAIYVLAKEKKKAPESAVGEPVAAMPAEYMNGDAAAGKTVFNGAGGCFGCHTFTAAGSTGTAGPNLDKIATSAEEANLDVDVYTEESIVDPNAYTTPGFTAGTMPPPSLSKKQIADLIAFIDQAS